MATLSPNQEHGRGIGRFWAAASLGFGSASLIGGIVYEFLGVNYLFILGALYGYIGCLIMLFAPRENFTLSTPVSFSKGYRGVLKDHNLRILCILSILILIASSAFNSFFTLYLVDFLSGSRLLAGLAATGTTTLGAIAYRLVGPLNDRLGRKPVFLMGTLGYAAYFGTLYFVTNPIIVTALWVLPIYPLIQSSAAALASDFTSTADRGKGLGLLESSLSLGGGIGPLAGGLIADASQFRFVIVFSLATSVLSMIGSQIFLKENPKTEEAAPQIPQRYLNHATLYSSQFLSLKFMSR
jgi:MFS family permease